MRQASRCGLMFGGFFLLVSFGIAAPPLPPSPPSPQLLPQGIADAKGHIGYVAGASGGIEALDLATGKVLWQNQEAQRPLLLDGDHLLAQAGVKRNRLRILRLDLKRDGECDLESDPIVFPAWVVTGEAPGHSFTANWRIEQHHLVLDWEARAWYLGAHHPTKEEAEAARKHAEGQVFVDLRTGQIDIRPAVKKEEPLAPPLPEALQQKALRWQGRVGPLWKVLALEESEGYQRFVLHSWDQGRDTLGEPEALLVGRRLMVRPTLDERILCLRETKISPEANNSLMSKKPLPPWHLFSTATGKSLGSIPYEPGMHAIIVANKRVYYLVPGALQGSLERGGVQTQTLRVRELPRGKKLWERPVAGSVVAPPPL